MSDCCKKLEAEIAALSAAIAALDSKFIPKPEKQQIIDQSVNLAKIAMAALLGTYALKSDLVPINQKAIDAIARAYSAESVAGAAKGKAENALSNAIDAQLKSKAARDAAAQASGLANKAKTVADTANDVATTAKNAAGGAQRTADQARRFAEASEALAKTAKGTADQAQSLAKAGKSLADKALGSINKVENALGKLEGKLQDVASKALKALGASESAISKAGAALSKAGDSLARVASLAGAVAGILALIGTFVSFQRIEALERVVDRQGNDLSSLYGIMYSFKARLDRYEDYLTKSIARLDDRIGRTYDFAGQAFDKAIEALRKATEAFSIGMNARNMAVNAEKSAQAAAIDAAEANAIATVANVAAIGAVSTAGNALRNAGNARQIGNNAQQTANRALQQASRPGRNGAPGKPGRDGKNGRNGLNGRNGKDGKNGKDAVLSPIALRGAVSQILPFSIQQNATRIRPFIINTGTNNSSNMRPQDLALLRRIDSTTRANLSTSGANLAVSRSNSSRLGVISSAVAAVQSTVSRTFTALEKFVKWSRIGYVLQVLQVWLLIHNALMLSNNLKMTLVSIVQNGYNFFKVKDSDGNIIDVNQQLNTTITGLVDAAIGEDNRQDLTIAFKKANRIYQAAANVMYAVTAIVDITRTVAEVGAERIGKVGNALRAWGVVSDKAYGYMSEVVTPASSTEEKIQGLYNKVQPFQDALNAVEVVSAAPVQMVDAFTQLSVAEKELELARQGRDADGTLIEDQVKTASASPDIDDPVAVGRP